MPQSHSRIPALDGVRGVAVLLVVVYHCFGKGRPSGNPLSWGWAGVDLFFVLSGFLIGGILWDTRDRPLWPFYRRRASRILPAYLLLLAVSFLLHGHQPSEIPLAAYLTFSQNWFAALFLFPEVLGATWSLAIEEQFYLFSPWLFRKMPKWGVVTALSITCAAAATFRVLIPQPALRYLLTICRADAIAAGCLLALAWREPAIVEWCKRKQAAITSLWLVAAAGIVCMLARNPWDRLVVGYSAVAFFWAVSLWMVLMKRPSWLECRVLGWFGTISYGLYLYHSAIIGIVQSWFASPAAVFVVVATVSTAAALLSWEYIERPLLHKY